MKFNIKDCFVCEFCRNICEGTCNEQLEEIKKGIITKENKDLIGRKYQIKCLGRFCDRPCKLQDLSSYENVDLSPFIGLINYLGNKCNELIYESKSKENQPPGSTS